MSRFVLLPRALALALLFAPGAWAASDPEIEAIRKEINDLKSNYEARIQALEQRLKEAEARPAAPTPAPAAEVAAPSSSGIAAFNPAISAILAGSYANLSQDPAKFTIPGFSTGGEIGPPRRGFSLGESELALSANVDPHFAGNLMLSVTPGRHRPRRRSLWPIPHGALRPCRPSSAASSRASDTSTSSTRTRGTSSMRRSPTRRSSAGNTHRWRAGEVDRAHRPVRRAGSGDRQRRRLPGIAAQQQRRGLGRASTPTRAATSATSTAGAPASRG